MMQNRASLLLLSLLLLLLLSSSSSLLLQFRALSCSVREIWLMIDMSALFMYVHKVAKSDSLPCPSVHLSAWNSSAPTTQIFMKFCTGGGRVVYCNPLKKYKCGKKIGQK